MNIFIPYIEYQHQTSCRVDVVWEVYNDNSLKKESRLSRSISKIQQRQVTASTRIPSNWQQFLRITSHKKELFMMLNNFMKTMSVPTSKELVITNETGVICRPMRCIDGLAPCNHEEADTRIVVHKKMQFLRDTIK